MGVCRRGSPRPARATGAADVHGIRDRRGSRGEYGKRMDDEPRRPRRTPRQLARAVDDGREVGAALRHLDKHGDEPGARGWLRRSLASSLRAAIRITRLAGRPSGRGRLGRRRALEKCARRAVPLVAEDLISLAGAHGRTPLARAQHIAARRRAEQIAVHVDQAAVLSDLGIKQPAATPERWCLALSSAVDARSRQQVATAVARSLSG